MRPNAPEDTEKTLLDLFDLPILPVQTSPNTTPASTDTQAQDTTLRRPDSSEPIVDPPDMFPATADADATTIPTPTPLRRSQRNRRPPIRLDIIAKKFEAGDLGPNTIVGSAAFNLFMIIAICVANRFLPRRYRRGSHGMIATEGEEMKMLESNGITQAYKDFTQADYVDPAVRAFEEHRQEFIELMREIRKKNPHISPTDLQKQAEGPKSRAFYRVQATRRLIGGGDIVKKRIDKEHNKAVDALVQAQEKQTRENTCKIYFDPAHYTVLENIGNFDVVVGRDGGPEGLTVMVDYYTEDGTANAGSDYVPVKGTLTFYPDDKYQASCKMTSDGTAIGDKHFETKEGELVFDDNQTDFIPIAQKSKIAVVRERVMRAFIDIGVMDTEQYERSDYFFIELAPPIWAKKMSDLSKVQERFQRRMEQKRRASIASESKESSEPGRTHTPSRDFLTTDPNQRAVSASPNLNSRFKKRMGSWIAGMKGADDAMTGLTADQLEIAELGKPRLGEYAKCQITIKESKEFQAPPTCCDYIMHFMTMPWKLLFATIPPTDYWGGWACFVVSIFMIGCLTALVGDLASQFGCWVGLKDSVTAISFVALGTSVPDTFASKVSAVQDKYADNSIGNVTGSNAVNVFLGIGIAWSVAAIYHFFNGTKFLVDPGNLGFSVLVFCLEACACITIIVLRRGKLVGGELGGPVRYRVMTSTFFMSLWFLYLILSALEAYCVIKGF
ncbi:sodium/calcium exchanger 1 [Ancylostoma ceylanicum]|uniref:Sodium/calcium exchanger 1 n=1 Tax=Ancylostoma ceylanicum TaxID=53326 RepID=A0A0D6LUD8_9BILA|nr:sodium/calcium exchanger 1 [Ancylostoma ceylanicum]